MTRRAEARLDDITLRSDYQPLNVNLIVTREDNKDAENVKKFVQAYQSEEVYQEANKVFNGGAVKVASW